MHVSLNWLKEFVDIPKDLDPKDLAQQLTLKTAEVDSVHNEGELLENIVVGEILEITPHPNADKLRITKTSIGPNPKETLQIVCGGINLKEGMLVGVAKVGARVKWHGQGDLVTMELTKIRGEESAGMICAGSEIGITDPEEQERFILDLSKTKAKPGTPLAELFKKNDTILEFDNKALTHRPDLWGHYGIAREVAALTDSKLKPIKSDLKIPTKGDSIKVVVQEPKLCPRYCGLVISNINVEPSPEWLKNRLLSIGHNAHNNIVDITNYVMSELGQPLHAFDKQQIKNSIVIRKANKGEKITTLDEKERNLTEEMLLIADEEKALAIAGIMGGQHSGITNSTTTIVLESATFNSSSVRRTSTALNLRTDAVQRFEKALDPNLAEVAINRAAELILQICPEAKIDGPITDIQNFDKTPHQITLDTDKAQAKIGVELSQKEIKAILEKLEFEIEVKDKKTFIVTVPTFRATKDVRMEDDLIEEIARMYGYEQLPAELPTLPTKLPLENTERFKKHRLRELLSYGLGFDEVYNYSFYGQSELAKTLMNETGHLKLQNYLSEDQTHLRTSLTPNILKNLQANAKNFEECRLYEIGRTYKEINEFYPLEEKKVTGAIMLKEKSDAPFFEAKGVVETVLKKFNVGKLSVAKGIKNTPYAHPNKSISYIDHNGQTIAKVFILHPTVAKNHDLENSGIGIFCINFTELVKIANEEKRYKQIPKYPSIEIDVSVLVDKNKEIGEIQKTISQTDESLITAVKLFDIYQGQNIEAGSGASLANKKSLAFKITLQASDRTLTDIEMTDVQKRIFTNLEKIGGTIRGK
ncbi:MAG: phenylalanine--tRNA ligase subunit beta [Patescibacteria group bacterium]